MARRKVFHSFRYRRDWFRVQTVLQMGVIQGQRLLTSNQWEAVERKGDAAIKRWIDKEMAGKSCVVVLIGSGTAGRRWVNYEMKKGWADGKGVVGVHIHGLKNSQQKQSVKGKNPLASVFVDTRSGRKRLSAVAKTYDPPYKQSKNVYACIQQNLGDWIEEAIRIRKAH